MGSDTEPLTSHKMIFPSLLLTLAATAQAGNIAEELTKMGATTLVDLVVKAGLADTLSNSGPFTVFALDNDAFSRVPQSIMDALASDVELLKSEYYDGFITINGKKVMKADIVADNGVIHCVS